MANEETGKPAAGAPKPAEQEPQTNAGNGDMAHLIGNMGILIDSTIESVQGMINTVSSATGQIMEGVNTTINSDQVKDIIDNVNSVSGQLIEGVTNTLNSEQLQNSFNELGKFWAGMISNLNSTVNSDQVKDLFDNVSSGINQLTGMVFSQGMQPPFMMGSGSGDEPRKQAKEIPVTLAAAKPDSASAPSVQSKPSAATASVPNKKPGA
ncbi:MAG TPA: chlorosome envelope protein H [Chlorobaculum parvum]|uniref:Chlorosome envelope protein H n=1 Tax=Chlorobaculum parvum TaxID=274539 RepID=A0A7C5HGH8_9CHLB|nr:chlorosome envelope protein H [Chlorobaculum parvum]